MGSGVLRLRRREVAAIVAMAVACAPSPAQAAEPGDYQALAQAIAAPWPGRQHSDGHFQEYIPGHDPRNKDDYGEAMLGYGLLQAGLRTGDQGMIIAGLNGVTNEAELPDSDAHIRMFRDMAIAGAYNLAREKLAGDEYFEQLRPAWERRLREVPLDRLRPGKKVTNKTLVEAVMVLELERSGLSGGARGSVLADVPGSVALVRRLVDRTLPVVRTGSRRPGAVSSRLALLGDRPDFPLAYHALSTAFLARVNELLGPRASARSRQLEQDAVAATWALAGPDGDLAYSGRSQEQIWTLTLTAYAAEHARSTGPAQNVAPLGGLADRVLARAGREYRGGPAAFGITPALARNVRLATRGVDSYASSVQYSGLGLVGLAWAQDAARPGLPVGAIAADTPGGDVLGRGTGRFATVRAGDVWFAVRQAPGTESDLRYDFGLVALKRQAGDGTWSDVMPIRPRSRIQRDTAGPVLRGVGAPVGTNLSLAGDGAVVVRGGFRAPTGRLARRGVTFRYEPLGCGVRLTVSPTSRGDAYDYSSFLRPGEPLPSRRTGVDRRYASGFDPALTRVRQRTTPRGGRPLAITTCAR
jgi:hypothetical protein